MFVQRRSRIKRSLGRTGAGARGPGHPVGHVGEPAGLVNPTHPGPGGGPNPGRGADLLRGRQLLDQDGAVLPGELLRLELDESGAQSPHQLDKVVAHHTSSAHGMRPSAGDFREEGRYARQPRGRTPSYPNGRTESRPKPLCCKGFSGRYAPRRGVEARRTAGMGAARGRCCPGTSGRGILLLLAGVILVVFAVVAFVMAGACDSSGCL